MWQKITKRIVCYWLVITVLTQNLCYINYINTRVQPSDVLTLAKGKFFPERHREEAVGSRPRITQGHLRSYDQLDLELSTFITCLFPFSGQDKNIDCAFEAELLISFNR